MVYKCVVVLKFDNGEYWLLLGEVLVIVGCGNVFVEVRVVFEKVVFFDLKVFCVCYFLGVVKDMVGDYKGVIDDWFVLLKDMFVGVLWEVDVCCMIEVVGVKDKIGVVSCFVVICFIVLFQGVVIVVIFGFNFD